MKLLMAVLACILLSAACVSQAGPSYPTTNIAPQNEGLTSASDFQITVYQGADILGGTEVKLSDLLAQGKPVALNFWAGLCPPCRAEMPDFQVVYEEYRDRVLLFGLDVGPFVGLGSREDGKALLKELKIAYPAGTTFDAGVVKTYEVLGMPTTYFIKPNGEVVDKWTGLLPKEKMVELLEELVAASAGP